MFSASCVWHSYYSAYGIWNVFLLLFSDVLVDGRHAKLVADSVAELCRCVRNLVKDEKVCATSIFISFSNASYSGEFLVGTRYLF